MSRIMRHFYGENAVLIPLVAAVGTGVVGAASFAIYTLRTNPDVVINKTGNPEPWLKINQDENKKLFNFHKDFFASREHVPSPSRAFLEGNGEGVKIIESAQKLRDEGANHHDAFQTSQNRIDYDYKKRNTA